MRFTWNTAKSASNRTKHGVGFEAIEVFDFGTALVEADTRATYDEPRLIGLGFIGPRLHVAIYSIERRVVRVISLRKANASERKRYDGR